MAELVRPNGHKRLEQLAQEWSSCSKCSLGQQRLSRQTKFVFGRGTGSNVMFIGEGPGVEEERDGEPFVGKSGDLLHRVLDLLGLDTYYETNLVACRSCSPQTDAAGLPMFRTNYRTKQQELVYKDEPPTPPQYEACMARLHEEIYLVDPVVIVGLGGKTCEALMGRAITITRDRGEPAQISVPGAGYAPVLTEKKKEWTHRTAEGVRTVNVQNMVRYFFIPTLHPAYVLRRLADMAIDSPFRQFVADIKKAVRVSETYNEMVFGQVPLNRPEANEEAMQHQLQVEHGPQDD